MNKDLNINKKILKRFFKLIDEGPDPEECLAEFPEYRTKLQPYASAIHGLENLKNISTDKNFEDQSLKEVYSRARIDKLQKHEKISERDALIIRLHPAYFKPLVVFLGVFIFVSLSYAGTIYASSGALPGDVLYSVKRTSENLQIAFIPYKYENAIYLKMLDKRLNEADSILSLADYNDAGIAEKLISDIDITYSKCRERNYLDPGQDRQMKMRIGTLKEGLIDKCGIKGANKGNCNTLDTENPNSLVPAETQGTGSSNQDMHMQQGSRQLQQRKNQGQ